MTSDHQRLIDLHCAGWEQINPSKDDTQGTKDRVLVHDLYGVSSGCWKIPATKK